jgi:hypothetical protein
MEKAIWISIVINAVAAIGLFIASMSSGQDAAGRSMIILPVFLLLLVAIVGYFLLRANYYGWALAVAGIPAAIVILILVFTLSQGFRNK